jgi:pyrroloquinoline quinone biosynthesis protein E
MAPTGTNVDPPLALLAELTHRCPLRCPYCSNPLELSRASAELDTASWKRVLGEAAALGVLQVHFSGGEPLARRDLVELVGHAAKVGLYGNLITSGIGLDADRLAAWSRPGSNMCSSASRMPILLPATASPGSPERNRPSIKSPASCARPGCP